MSASFAAQFKSIEDFITAMKVQFKRPVFEDDFPEKGMVAWLTDIEWDVKHTCYKLYLDFGDFEDENQKYFKASYYGNKATSLLAEETGRTLFTAKEAGYYSPKYSAYISPEGFMDVRNDTALMKELDKHFICLDN